MRIVFLGDIVGKGGRKAVCSVLPDMKSKLKPDLVIANAENIAHGVGITKKTLDEMRACGVDAFTSGNHVWSKEEVMTFIDDPAEALVRPHNLPTGPGTGARLMQVGAYQLLLINLQGQVFMREGVNNPFVVFDEIMALSEAKSAHAIIVDFHAEATSEKVGFGWHADGRASAVLGTHTHVPTADFRILPQGTAFITDVGMCGPRDSVIGVDKDVIVATFRTARAIAHKIPEHGSMVVNAVVIDIDPKTKHATSIERVDRIVDISVH